jgi:hypothetical protein
MANVFETSLLSRQSSANNRVRPQLADAAFWSDVLISQPDTPPPPLLQYTLVTDTGDELVDGFDNQLVAAF